jgi:hypothetical protein
MLIFAVEYESPKPKKVRQERSKMKIMLFLDVEGIVHYEYVPKGQTVNQHYCVEVLK